MPSRYKLRKIRQESTRGEQREVLRVAGYIRVSTDEQAKSGLGLADQRQQIADQARVKGWPEPVIYADEGISGTKDDKKRPGLARLRNDIREGRIDVVIVRSMDRLGRRVRILVEMVDEMNAYHVKLVSCKESIDTTTPQGQAMFHMVALFAELERGLIAERVAGALAEKSRTDGDAGGKMPYGYVRAATGVVKVDAGQARIVRDIFALREQGRSLRQIAERIRRRGKPGPRGGLWHHTSIAEILANRAAYDGGLRGESQHPWPKILRPQEAAA